MFEYHSWAVIHENTFENNECKLNKIVSELSLYLDQLKMDNGLIDLRAANGQYHFNISGFDNHRPQGDFHPVSFFKYISSMAKGSYGMFYVRDDDRNQSNSFKVYTLAKGNLQVNYDGYLSPCNPIIED